MIKVNSIVTIVTILETQKLFLRKHIRKHNTRNILEKTLVDDWCTESASNIELLWNFVLKLLKGVESLDTKCKEKDADDEPIFTCKKCQFETRNFLLLNDHKKEKHRIFDCDICNFTSSSGVGLNIHKTKHHFKCGKYFSISST